MVFQGWSRVYCCYRTIFLQFSAICLLVLTVSGGNSDLPNNYDHSQDDVRLLEENKPVEREVTGGVTHVYRLTAEAGEYVNVMVDQRGVDLLVRLIAPDGKLVTAIDNPNGTRGSEPVHVVADAAGVFRIEITPFEKNARPGRYEIRIAQRRPATQNDRERRIAREIFDEGEKFFKEHTSESYSKAAQKYIDARTRYRAIGDQVEEITPLIGLGMAYREMGELQKAIDAFDQALPIALALGDRSRLARVYEITAGIHSITGDLERSLQGRLKALALYQETGDQLLEASLLDRVGSSYNTVGEHDQARILFERSRDLYQKLGYPDEAAYTLRSIGYSYHLEENWPKALEYYKKSLELQMPVGDQREIAITHSLIGTEYARIAQKKEAVEHITEAMRISEAFSGQSTEAIVMVNVGRGYHDLGDLDKALSLYERPLRRYRYLSDKRNEAVVLRHRALALRDKGQLSEAHAEMERSISLLEFMREHSGSPELRASFVASLFDYYEIFIDLKMRMHAAAPNAGHDSAALEFAETVRMRSLVELIAQARIDLRQNIDPKLLEREKRINEAMTAKLDELTQLLRRKFTEEQRRSVEREIDTLKEEHIQVQLEIRRSSPHYGSFAAPRPLSVKDIQRQLLDDDTILLEYKLGAERSHLWAVTPNGLRSFRLPARKEIEKHARRLYELIQARTANATASSEYSEHANALSNMLLGPVAAELGTKRLLVVADGALQYLPFGALPAPSKGKAGESPLLLDHEIVSLPSASVLDVLRREYGNRTPAPRMAAVFADPVYATDDARVRPTASGQRGADKQAYFQRLLFSRGEAETILSVAPSNSNMLALDFESSRQRAMSPDLSKYRIIHFSTHGSLDSRRPELSGLVLSQVTKTGEPQEGTLRLHEIYNLRLNADLVVLSACQTALGKDVRGEGLVGLTRGFMYAGSRRVMASLWQVDDAATAALMKEFYRGLLVKKLTAPAALRAAQISILKKKAWRSPYYWGAFVLQGDWK